MKPTNVMRHKLHMKATSVQHYRLKPRLPNIIAPLVAGKVDHGATQPVAVGVDYGSSRLMHSTTGCSWNRPSRLRLQPVALSLGRLHVQQVALYVSRLLSATSGAARESTSVCKRWCRVLVHFICSRQCCALVDFVTCGAVH